MNVAANVIKLVGVQGDSQRVTGSHNRWQLGRVADFSVFMSSRVLHQVEKECGGRVR